MGVRVTASRSCATSATRCCRRSASSTPRALNNCEDVDALGRALDKYWVYKRVFETAIQGEQMSVDDAFYLNEVRLLEGGFDSQFHLACYYCYCHLKLQEIRNITWICECIVQKQRGKIEKYIPIFSSNAAWRHGKLGL